MRRKSLSLVATLAAGVVLAGAQLPAAEGEVQYGTERPLEARRYQTLRALAGRLDETARGAAEGVDDEARRGSASAARMLWPIRDFARRADDCRRILDEDRTSGFEVRALLDELATSARQVDDGIRADGTLASTRADWEAVLEVLERMNGLLAGRSVDVPAAHVVAPLAGARLEEFRQLASALDLSAVSAYETAKRDVGEYPRRGPQFLGELRYFAARSRDLQARADAAEVHPQQLGPIVDRLLEEAREADRTMRDARVFKSVWSDSGRTITLLSRMADLVRS